MTERETIILDFQVEQGDAISELEKTKKSIIGLKKEQQELNKAYKEGNVDLDEYAAEQVRLEAILKKQTNQYNTVQKSVTGVTTQFDKLINSNKGIQKSLESTSGSLAALVPGFSGAASGVTSVTTASKAFIATPIGAVIGALALGVAALTRFFRDNEEGQNKFNTLMNIGAAVVGKLTDAISALGGFLFDKLGKGLEYITDILVRFVPGFDQLLKQTREYLNLDRADFISKLQAETDLLERQLIVEKARLSAKVAENKLRAEDKSLDLKVRKQALSEASKAQRDLNDLELKYAENKLKIIQETNKQSNSNKEALKQEAEAEAQLFLVRKDAADKQKEIFTKNQEISNLEKAAIDKKNQALAEEIRLKNDLATVNERLNQSSEKEIAQYEPKIKGKLDENAATHAVTQANKEQDKSNEAIIESEARKRAVTEATIGTFGQLATTLVLLAGKNKDLAIAGIALERATAISQVVSNTGIANAKAVAATPLTFGQPFVGINTVSAILSIGTILAQAAQSFGEVSKAAGGGKFVTRGPALLMVGDNPGGVERVTVEPISGRGKTVVNGNLAKMAGGGVLETQSVTGPINASMAFRSTMDRQPIIYASWKEATELSNRIQFKESLVTA